jgi:hypothetical protein
MSNQVTKSPLEHFLGWFTSLPPEQQHMIAIAAYFMPGFAYESDNMFERGQAAALFVDRVTSYMDHEACERGAATVLHMCLEYMTFANHGTGNWRERQAGIREAADDLGFPELHEAADAAQFKHAQWVQTHEKWHLLKAGPFSLDAIHSFRRLDPNH